MGALAPRVTEAPGPLSVACHHHPSAHSYIPRRDRAAGLPRGTAVTHSTEQRVPEGQLTSFSLGVRVEISSHQITGSPSLGRRCLYYPHFTQRNRQRACTEAQRQLQTGAVVTRRGIQVRSRPAGRPGHLSILASAGQRQPCDQQANCRRPPEATELRRPSAHCPSAGYYSCPGLYNQ